MVSDKNKAEYRDLFFQRFPSLKGRRLILFLGRITPKKNCLSLIKAFKRCFFRDKRLLLLMVGPIDRSYKKKIAKEIKNSEIDKNMFWIDFLSEKERSGAYLASEVFILPSHQENFGMSVVEALAHSCPVLISDKVGIHQTVSFSKSGYVEPDTLKGCEKLLERWLSLAYNERCNMRIAAEKCFLDYFEINTVAEMFALRMAKFVEKE
ncbi:MAG: glycosyltransferase [Candidatus Omnitrophica bacterium]|nr:glycosyltransferase [Candidatus Omnitrophota bacterium]